ncbi:MAG TPA: hypothetical protein PKD09_10365 [Aggregatilinea sp.]|uniref:hypothetical protein n=1 Tax=Aggregatilinea sp. TaxID=2806333 RepID=UPI002BA30D3D|nr:hypothetical protein [Aggregatilinea sp.]HML22045.1 hypothetical protein [Aggregatilinea sp.]
MLRCSDGLLGWRWRIALDDAGGATVALLGSLQVGGAVLVPPLYQKRPAVLSP